MGYATGLSNFALSYALAVTSVSPSNGSIYGGTVVTVQGSGFSAKPGDNALTISGLSCAVISSSAQQLQCVTQRSSVQKGDLKVQIGSVSTVLPKAFSFLSSLTPVVTSVSPSQLSPRISTPLSLTGSLLTLTNAVSTLVNFSDVTSVLIGTSPCPISFANSTAVSCTAPALPAGTYPVYVNSVGLGLSSGTPGLTIPLTLSSVQPTKGGLAGGLLVTLTGSGFSPSSTDYNVTIGGARCVVLNSSWTGLRCLTGAAPAGTWPIQASSKMHFPYVFKVCSLESSSASPIRLELQGIDGWCVPKRSLFDFLCRSVCPSALSALI